MTKTGLGVLVAGGVALGASAAWARVLRTQQDDLVRHLVQPEELLEMNEKPRRGRRFGTVRTCGCCANAMTTNAAF
jgi:hypothetical protein